MKAEEDKENGDRGCLAGGLQGSRLLPPPAATRPQPLSDVEDYTSGRHLHLANSTLSFLPEISSSNKSGAVTKVQHSSPAQLSQFWTYAAGNGGSVEHWKKLARKAELEMHLEQEQHKSDREKDLDSIHRLRCRISALEAAAQDRDVMTEKQRRKINLLKSQLGGVNKRFGKELSILRNQSEQMQRNFTSVTGVSEKKILELKEELQVSESKTKLLGNQLGLIYKCIEEPLEMFNLTELHERAPESVQQSSTAKSSKKSWKKQGILEPDGSAQGFDDFTMAKGDSQSGAKDASSSNIMKKRQPKTTMAGRILQLRAENNILNKQVGQRDERLKSLFHEAEHLRKQLKEAVGSRNSAICQVREIERLFEKLEAMEPLIVKAGIMNEQDLNSNTEDCSTFSVAKGRKSVDHEPKETAKDESNMEVATATLDETNTGTGKFPRKQAFRKWANILNKIRSALLVFVSKVHATSQLESNLKLEIDSLTALSHKLQQEVLTELDSRSLHSMAKMEGFRGEDQIESDKISARRDYRSHAMSSNVDRELIHKILIAVREQKRKLLLTTGRVEDLKKEKISSDACLFSKQKKISELEKRLEILGSEQEILSTHLTCLNNMLDHIDDFHVSEGQKHAETIASSSGQQYTHSLDLKSKQKNMTSLDSFEKRCKLQSLVKKVQSLLKERDELRAGIIQLQAEKQGLCGQLTNWQNGMKCFNISVEEEAFSNENLHSQIKQLKVHMDELESFYEEAGSCHKAITKNLQLLESIVTEDVDYNNSKLYGIEYVMNKVEDKSLLQEPFIKAVLGIPDIIFKTNLLRNEHKEFDSKLHKAELERQEAESRLSEQENLVKLSVSSQRELEDMKQILEDIYKFLSSDNTEMIEAELLGPTIMQQLQKMKEELQEIIMDNAVSQQRFEELKRETSSAHGILLDALRFMNSLKADMLKEFQNNADTDNDKSVQHHGNIKDGDETVRRTKDSDTSLTGLLSNVKTCLDEVQSLRKTYMWDVATRFEQELKSVKEQLESNVRHSESLGNDWNEKVRLLSEEINSIKAEKEVLLVELSASSTQIRDLQLSLQKFQEKGNAKVSSLEEEKDSLNQQKEALTAEIERLKLQNQEQSLSFENSRKELCNTVQTLENKLSSMKDEHSGSMDSVEDLRRLIREDQSRHEQALQEWRTKTQRLEGEVVKMQHEKDSLDLEIRSLETKAKEKELMMENLTKVGVEQAEFLQQELARAIREQSGSGNEILKLQSLLKEQDLAATKLKSQYSEKIDSVDKENSELRQERVRLTKQLEQLQQAVTESETLCKQKLKALAAEVLRLGGPDITDETEKSRRQAASEKVKDYLSRGLLPDLLLLKVENEAHKQLEVSSTFGGLTQAAIHYFTISQQYGEITFENGNLPGSQSSNMLAELTTVSRDMGGLSSRERAGLRENRQQRRQAKEDVG